MQAKQSQIVSKQRVADHGEVFTRPEEVNAMIDLVKHQAERIDATFLEPACGNGNFLVEILDRKLSIVMQKYKKSQTEFEQHALAAVASLYGIELLRDNVEECRERLYDLLLSRYMVRYRRTMDGDFLASIRYVLERNIIHGDALTLRVADGSDQPIVFSDWSLMLGGRIQRRDYRFEQLIQQRLMLDGPLFSDLGEEAYIPQPLGSYPAVYYREVHHAY